MGFLMEAKRKGICRVCRNPINAGDRIDYDRDEGTAAHALCAGSEGGPGGKAEDVARKLGFVLHALATYETCARCGRAFEPSADPTECPHGRKR